MKTGGNQSESRHRDQLTAQQNCADKFLTGGIGNCGSDAKCICSDKSFLSDIACCLAEPGACDTADQSSAVVFASQLCAAQGVTVPSAVTCTSTFASTGTGTGTAASATTTGTATATETGTTAAATGATGGTTATTTSSSSTSSSSSSSSTSSSASGTAAAATTSSSSTNYAPRESAAVGAGLVGGLVAALAML